MRQHIEKACGVTFGLRWGTTVGAILIAVGIVAKDWIVYATVYERMVSGHAGLAHYRAAVGLVLIVVGMLLFGRCAAGNRGAGGGQ